MIKRNIFRYWGGKSQIAEWVISKFPFMYEEFAYVEPFCGSAIVLLNKEPSRHEVINDIDKSLFYLYRAIRERPKELTELLDKTLFSVNELNYAVDLLRGKIEPPDDDWIHFARAKFVSLNMSLMGTGERGAISLSVAEMQKRTSRAKTFRKTYARIDEVCDRLKNVAVVNKDVLKVIAHYDSPNTLFYLDPPYPDTDHRGYNHPYTMDEFNKLTDVLKNIKGKYLISFEKKEGMTCFDYEKAKGRYFYSKKIVRSSKTGINSGEAKHALEYLMCNYHENYCKQLSFF